MSSLSDALDPSTVASLLSNPYQHQIASASVISSLVYAFAATTVSILAFSYRRHRPETEPGGADVAKRSLIFSRHAWSWGWLRCSTRALDLSLVDQLGLDAVVHLLFLRGARNVFGVIGALGLLMFLLMTCLSPGGDGSPAASSWLTALPPPGKARAPWHWTFVGFAYSSTAVVFASLLWDYRILIALRQADLRRTSAGDRRSDKEHAVEIPGQPQTDEGFERQVLDAPDDAADDRTAALSRGTDRYGQLVRGLERACQRFEATVRGAEAWSKRAQWLLPRALRDRAERLLTSRVASAAEDWASRRRTAVDQALPESEPPDAYGFLVFQELRTAHDVARRRRGSSEARLKLAPDPDDLQWGLLASTPATRTRRRRLGLGAMLGLTLVFAIPNAITAVLLSNLSTLGIIWPHFLLILQQYPAAWGIIQGIGAPLAQAVFYASLPSLCRGLLAAGSDTFSGRERLVLTWLTAFLIVNRVMLFTLFATLWTYAVATAHVSSAAAASRLFVRVVVDLTRGLMTAAPFWLASQIQLPMAGAVALLRLLPSLASGPQPGRPPTQERGRCPPSPFAECYSVGLVAATVGLVFAPIQVLICPVTAIYFGFDNVVRSYLLQQVSATSHESDGKFWPLLVDGWMVALLSMQVVVIVLATFPPEAIRPQWAAAGATAPLFVCVALFRWYAKRYREPLLRYIEAEADGEKGSDSDSRARRQMEASERGSVLGKYRPGREPEKIQPVFSASAVELFPDALDSIPEVRCVDTSGKVA